MKPLGDFFGNVVVATWKDGGFLVAAQAAPMEELQIEKKTMGEFRI